MNLWVSFEHLNWPAKLRFVGLAVSMEIHLRRLQQSGHTLNSDCEEFRDFRRLLPLIGALVDGPELLGQHLVVPQDLNYDFCAFAKFVI